MVPNVHSMPIYTQTLVIDVDRVEFSRSPSLPHVPYLSTVVDESQYPGILEARLPRWSDLCNIHTLTLETDVGVHYHSIVFVHSVQMNRTTTLPHSPSKFTMVDTSHFHGKLPSDIHKCVYNVLLHSNQVTYISSANANNNNIILQNYKR